MSDPMGFMIPTLGGLWALSFVVGWIILPFVRHFKEQRKMLEEQRDQLHKLNVQIPHLIDFVHQIRSKMEDIQDHLQMQVSKLNAEAAVARAASQERAAAIGAPMPGSASVSVNFDGIRSDFNSRIASIEKKLDELTPPAARPPAPEEEVVEENVDPSEPVPFEVYREGLLRLWDGKVSLEEHCNEWRGRLVLPRPGRKARA